MAHSATLSKEEILSSVVEILKDMTSDWEMEFSGPISAETNLIGDLEFESIDVVQFIVAIEEKFKQRQLPFEKLLMQHGRYVDELPVRAAVDFLHTHLNATR